MDTLEAGLIFSIRAVGAEAGAVLLGDASGELRVAAEHMWAPRLLSEARDLWHTARGGAHGPLLSHPVLALPVEADGRLVGLLCLSLPERPTGRPTRIEDLGALARLLIDSALDPIPQASKGLAVIHQAADPKRALLRCLERSEWNVSALARDLGCSRKAVYEAAERYGVRIGGRRP
jgi:hypothetical protein